MRPCALLVLCAGCATLPSFESAHPLAPGRWQLGVEPSLLVTHGTQGDDSALVPGLVLRRGFGERLELGLRAGLLRPELTLKLSLLDPGDFALALTSTLGVWVFDSDGIDSVQAYGKPGLIMGTRIGDSVELVLSAKLDVTAGHDLDTPVWALAFAPIVSTGVVLTVTPWLGLVPELALAYSLVQFGSGRTVTGGGVAAQAGIALLFTLGGE